MLFHFTLKSQGVRYALQCSKYPKTSSQQQWVLKCNSIK